MRGSPILAWDIDGTLLTAAGAGERALRSALHETFAIEVNSEGTGIPLAGRTDRFITGALLEKFGVADTLEHRERLWANYLPTLETLLATGVGRVLPGVPEALASARRRGWRQGVLTGNLARAAAAKLRYCALEHWFEFGIYGDQEPERSMLGHRALETLALLLGTMPSPADLVIIGDTPYDATVAHAIGARCVLVATGPYSHATLATAGADLLLPDLSDGGRLLEWIERRD